jgi:hypothetical protein
MKRALGIGLGVLWLLHAAPAAADVYYVTVAGLGGEADYTQQFTAEATTLDKLLKGTGPDAHVVTLMGDEATRAKLTDALEQIARTAKPDDAFVLILIGHGSYDGVEYKFNLPGPDISGAELAALCDRVPAKRQLVVNTTSCSGGSVPVLQRTGRAVIAATKSGTEKNATVFARYWVEALQDPAADLDKSESINALEAFEYAERKTAEFYTAQKRLATEHAVFEDTGHGEPVREASTAGGEGRLLASLTIVRFGAAQRAALDPAKRALFAQKEDLERQIDALKYQKAAMPQAEYEQQLKALLIKLARVQAALDQ